jgi:hypothetical protein
MDGLGHGHGGGGGGHHGGGHARGSRGGFRSGGDYVVDDGPICFCDGKPCPCPYATFQGMGDDSDPGQQAGGAWCGTLGARPPHCQGCIAHPIYTSRLGAMGAYYANTFEQPISGLGTCPCAKQGPSATGALVGDDSSYPSPAKVALACGAVAVVVMLALKIKV